MRKTTRLKQLIEDPRILVMPGAYDALSARLIEEAGFNAVQASGANIVACHFGVPDYSLVSAREMAEHTARIAAAVRVPVMADADTGFGNAVNTYLAVKEFEKAGTAGVNIEDQVMPKRCGHLEGKVLLPIDEAVAKIAAAVDARTDQDFVINARTDALGVHANRSGLLPGTNSQDLKRCAATVMLLRLHPASVSPRSSAGEVRPRPPQPPRPFGLVSPAAGNAAPRTPVPWPGN